ncbi:MAG: DUF4349 domain-containing protein [Oscillospiraceae bacterium]|nr:DUF4349 domain-containing protein [Oscillospiraceae bacterium]
MKQCLSLIASILALALLLSACGGGNGGRDNGGAMPPGSMAGESNSAPSADYAPEAPEEDAGLYNIPGDGLPAAGNDSSTSALDSAQVKMIYRGSLHVETLDFNQAAAMLDSLVSSLGGYFESSSLWQGGYYSSGVKSANYTIRVPSEQFEAFLTRMGEEDSCRVVRQERSAEDIGAAYHDTEARLKTLRIQQERLQNLLSQAETMVDIIDLENALSNVEYEIEQYTSTLNRYDSLVGFATIELSLEQVERLSDAPAEQETLGQKMSRGFQSAVERFGAGLASLAVWFAYNFITVLLFAAILAGAAVFLVRWKKSGRAPAVRPSKSSVQPAEPAESQPKGHSDPPDSQK